jgi:hypothetical protein
MPPLVQVRAAQPASLLAMQEHTASITTQQPQASQLSVAAPTPVTTSHDLLHHTAQVIDSLFADPLSL